MLFDEARIRHELLTAEARRIEQNAAWEQARRLDALQRRVTLVRARLGLGAAVAR